jgi:hypothetical protein
LAWRRKPEDGIGVLYQAARVRLSVVLDTAGRRSLDKEKDTPFVVEISTNISIFSK